MEGVSNRLDVSQRRLRVQAGLCQADLALFGPLPTVLGMRLQVFQHHVAVASATLLGPGAAVVHVVLQLVERKL